MQGHGPLRRRPLQPLRLDRGRVGDDRDAEGPARGAGHRRPAAARHGREAPRRGRARGPAGARPGRIFVGNEMAMEGTRAAAASRSSAGLMSSGDVGHFDDAGPAVRRRPRRRDDRLGRRERVPARGRGPARRARGGVRGRGRRRRRRGVRPAPARVRRRSSPAASRRRTSSRTTSRRTSPATRFRARSCSSRSCRATRPARSSSASSPRARTDAGARRGPSIRPGRPRGDVPALRALATPDVPARDVTRTCAASRAPAAAEARDRRVLQRVLARRGGRATAGCSSPSATATVVGLLEFDRADADAHDDLEGLRRARGAAGAGSGRALVERYLAAARRARGLGRARRARRRRGGVLRARSASRRSRSRRGRCRRARRLSASSASMISRRQAFTTSGRWPNAEPWPSPSSRWKRPCGASSATSRTRAGGVWTSCENAIAWTGTGSRAAASTSRSPGTPATGRRASARRAPRSPARRAAGCAPRARRRRAPRRGSRASRSGRSRSRRAARRRRVQRDLGLLPLADEPGLAHARAHDERGADEVGPRAGELASRSASPSTGRRGTPAARTRPRSARRSRARARRSATAAGRRRRSRRRRARRRSCCGSRARRRASGSAASSRRDGRRRRARRCRGRRPSARRSQARAVDASRASAATAST